MGDRRRPLEREAAISGWLVLLARAVAGFGTQMGTFGFADVPGSRRRRS